MRAATLAGFAILAGSLITIALTDLAKSRDAYRESIEACYFDDGCSLNHTEYRRFIERQEADIEEGIRERGNRDTQGSTGDDRPLEWGDYPGEQGGRW